MSRAIPAMNVEPHTEVEFHGWTCGDCSMRFMIETDVQPVACPFCGVRFENEPKSFSSTTR